MNKLVICPACGSELIDRVVKESLGQLTLGSEFKFEEIIYKCRDCEEEGDFLGESDKNYLAAQKNAQINLVKQILEELNDAGITMSFVERVFELPPRTLTRWKTGDFSSTSIAFLRILKTYPWITEVAEYKFMPFFAQYAVLRSLMSSIKEMMDNSEKLNMFTPGANIKNYGPVYSMQTVITSPMLKISADKDLLRGA